MPKIINNIKDTLLSQGKKILLNNGYSKLNIREVTKESGVATGTFYNYFKSKEDLAINIFREDWNKILKSVSSIELSPIPLKDKLETVHLYIDEFLSSYIPIFFEMNAKHYGCRKESIMDPLYNVVEKILEFHRNKDEISNPLSNSKLSQLIINNLITISRTHYITFNEFFISLNL
ncbi:TetR/AcrR family transcriptional regulator [Clostridium hydrogeniformans]|uniref:TetR/AcrR family transcriptional regulator n=1 Tax=Clostridium hydrogeniformans TaxID=349933 RepID=UPI0004828041|nr:TetR/AcrR family transcriptional regulator [Clostridium hydrogeniformans]